MTMPIIRPARIDEHDAIARVWMESWCSTGLAEESRFLLAQLRARLPREIENGWSLFVAAAWQGRSLGRRMLAFTRTHLPDEILLRCVRENEKAWRWYEREGFVFEQEQVEAMTGFVMKHYRWRKAAECEA